MKITEVLLLKRAAVVSLFSNPFSTDFPLQAVNFMIFSLFTVSTYTFAVFLTLFRLTRLSGCVFFAGLFPSRFIMHVGGCSACFLCEGHKGLRVEFELGVTVIEAENLLFPAFQSIFPFCFQPVCHYNAKRH